MTKHIHMKARRIIVTGNAGSGKSTFARAVGEAVSVEVISLDSVVWRPGWQAVRGAERARAEMAIAEQPRWVVDGVSSRLCEAADTIVFLDLPRSTCYWRCAKRSWPYLFSSRPGMPERCPEILILPTLTKIIWQFPRTVRPRLIEGFESWRGSKNLFHVNGRRGFERVLREVCDLACGD